MHFAIFVALGPATAFFGLPYHTTSIAVPDVPTMPTTYTTISSARQDDGDSLLPVPDSPNLNNACCYKYLFIMWRWTITLADDRSIDNKKCGQRFHDEIMFGWLCAISDWKCVYTNELGARLTFNTDMFCDKRVMEEAIYNASRNQSSLHLQCKAC